ncbi:DNA helicase PcrA [Catenibacillus scindens]|uniref:DNA helicase PcrA n=1 Tax=Catenibacillus scindens TaxID=673271 RepID=UPI0032082A19
MSIYETLNPVQQEAVYHTEGPLLILAGAGSGKTRVLTHRIAYLIDEKNVNPWNILAITFTNKAAGEMRERVDQIVGYGSENIWVSTFHSTCVRILRRYIDKIGYERNFTIYDTDDQKSVIKEVCKQLNIDTKIYKERTLLSAISSAKDELVTPKELLGQAHGDLARTRVANVYEAYQKKLKSNNALDFDDLIMKTVELLKTQPDVLDYYQQRFRYIMVDEYQDTNTAQFKFVSILADKYQNLCVVGDDDQSIYKFRGANIYNILNFEKQYPQAKVIKLEQNYRSTKNILAAANGVISNNAGRKDKALWTSNERGDLVDFCQYNTEYEEAAGVVDDIYMLAKDHQVSYKDCAVLYRTNAQSRVLEEKFVLRGIPYRMIGGQNFYARKEIKDLLCYLKTIDNGQDDLAVRRIINVPKRGIGATSLSRVDDYALNHGVSFFEALEDAKEIPGLGKAGSKISAFVNMIQVFRAQSEYISLSQLFDDILDETGYVKELEDEKTEEAMGRIENIEELRNKIVAYEEEHEHPDLSEFLEEVSLVADIDSLDETNDKVVLMTLHSAKGLEFPYVFMTGMEDGLFPSYMSIVSDDSMEIEEERRLCYVGITRAMKHLTLTCAKSRMVHGNTQYNKISRFVREIPAKLLHSNRPLEGDSDRTWSRYGEFSQTEPSQSFGRFGAGIQNNSSGLKGFQSAEYGRASVKGADSFSGGPKSDGSNFISQGRSKLDELLKSQKIFKGSDIFSKKSSNPSSDIYGGKMNVSARQKIETAQNLASGLNYGEGDRVKHVKFGEGTVVSIVREAADYVITVSFDKAGVKKMKAGFARLKKI